MFWFPFRVKGKYTLDTAEIYRSIITSKSHFIFEKICLDKPTIILDCINILDDAIIKRVTDVLDKKPVKNSGMICGPRSEIVSLLIKVYNDMKECNVEYFGIDQLFFNYECCKLKENQLILLSNEYNYVLITNKDNYSIKDEMVYNEHSNMVTVVHNAGGHLREIKKGSADDDAVINEQFSRVVRNFVEDASEYNTHTINGITYTFSDLNFYRSIGYLSYYVKDDSLNVKYGMRYDEVKFSIPRNMSLKKINSIIVNGTSINGHTAIKFYDEDDAEVFVMHNNISSNPVFWVMPLKPEEKEMTIRTIGIMSQDAGKYSAKINSIIFK